MRIERVRLQKVRNLTRAEFQPNPRFNLFFGQNGAGKTALLESLHLLSDARTFRHSQIRPLIQEGESEAVVSGEVYDPGSQKSTTVGVSKSSTGDTRIRVAGSEDWTASRLARLVPMQTFLDVGADLVGGGSKPRRQMMDWGMFHVEHRFYPAWSRMRQILRQRNQLLRRGSMCRSELRPWNDQLGDVAEELDQYRSDYTARLCEAAKTQWSQLLDAELGIRLKYQRGWDDSRSLVEVLMEQESRDLAQGYTTVGPHRADLRIRSNLGETGKVLSRGQIKMTTWGLKVAQLSILNESVARKAICLVDDLPAELDRDNQEKLLKLLWDSESQVFITALESGLPFPTGIAAGGVNMFHVEHGRIESALSVSGAN